MLYSIYVYKHQMMREGQPHWNVLRVNRESTLMYHRTIEANLTAEVNLNGQKTKEEEVRERKETNSEIKKKGGNKTLEQFLLFYLMFCLL